MGAHSLGLVSSSSNFRTGQSGVISHKTQNENYSNAAFTVHIFHLQVF